MYIARTVAALATSACSGFALAGTPNVIPEPETLALLAVGVAAVAAARWLEKRR